MYIYIYILIKTPDQHEVGSTTQVGLELCSVIIWLLLELGLQGPLAVHNLDVLGYLEEAGHGGTCLYPSTWGRRIRLA